MASESSKQNSLADTHENSNVTDKLRLMMMIYAYALCQFLMRSTAQLSTIKRHIALRMVGHKNA